MYAARARAATTLACFSRTVHICRRTGSYFPRHVFPNKSYAGITLQQKRYKSDDLSGTLKSLDVGGKMAGENVTEPRAKEDDPTPAAAGSAEVEQVKGKEESVEENVKNESDSLDASPKSGSEEAGSIEAKEFAALLSAADEGLLDVKEDAAYEEDEEEEDEEEGEEEEGEEEDEHDDTNDKMTRRPLPTRTRETDTPESLFFNRDELLEERAALHECYAAGWTPYESKSPVRLSNLVDKYFTYQRNRFPNSDLGREMLAEVIGDKRKAGMKMVDFDTRVLFYRYGVGGIRWSKFPIKLYHERYRITGWPDDTPTIGIPKGKVPWREAKSAEVLIALWHDQIKLEHWHEAEVQGNYPPLLIYASERKFRRYDDMIKKHLREEAQEAAKLERRRIKNIKKGVKAEQIRQKRAERREKQAAKEKIGGPRVERQRVDYGALAGSMSVAPDEDGKGGLGIAAEARNTDLWKVQSQTNRKLQMPQLDMEGLNLPEKKEREPTPKLPGYLPQGPPEGW
ncbi:hypothetical protein DACRYDRAFT_119797 [Dacryopinax primogenitus]|uniref:Uncharacterized protein n=1 Tax=Dacryopinax primogenitus (strain DJM 731) TaxID=1858805 RepID=M5FZS0_DACPD|nr:uncharacterized protein DACRYDRAFT_119797 [Dacryopinax primogenitus]EJT97007.1 hypothetical protein DACRYDRAFT_119797 [Dacryopinax primogenitus]